MSTNVVIVDAVRTPIGRRNKSLAEVHPVDLSAFVLNELIQRNGIRPEEVDDVIWGCVTQVGAQSSNVGRLAVLAAGWPETVPGTTVDRACGSSQQALHFGVAGVASGQYDIAIAGGVESMSQVPMGAGRAVGMPYGPKVIERYQRDTFSQGLGAEEIARRWNISRADLDEYALRSHERAAAATDAGAFDGQLLEFDMPEVTLRYDEGIRRETSLEALAGLDPVFDDAGVVTAGNSSQISDGSSALLIMTEENALKRGLVPLAIFRAGVVIGDDPVTMLTAPIPATHKLLQKTGLSIDDIGAFEVNEAFAPVVRAWQLETGAPDARTNPMGGAIAVGHPLGASGAILMTRLVHHLQRNELQYGLQTMCEAGGMANATLVERWMK